MRFEPARANPRLAAVASRGWARAARLVRGVGAGRSRHALLAGVLAAVSCQAAAQDPVQVRKGDHATFSRIVFDFETAPAYQARLEDGRVLIAFEREASFDFGALPGDPLERLSDPAVVAAEDGRSVVALEAGTAGRLRHFLSGSSVVIDLMDPKDEAGAAPAPTQGGGEGESADGASGRDGESQSRRGAASDAADASASSPSQAARENPSQQSGRGERGGGNSAVRVTARRSEAGLYLVYHWDSPTPAAVFTRAGHLWVVFGAKREIDHSGLDWSADTPVSQHLGAYRRIEQERASVLRYELRGEPAVSIERESAAWRVQIGEAASYPRRAIEPQRRVGSQGAHLFMPAESVGPRLTLSDPGAGDTLEVVPLGRTGRALPERGRFVGFDLLATAQGIALAPLSEEVGLVRYANGVAVESESADGLRLSRSALSGESGESGAQRLIDLEAWRGLAGKRFLDGERALLTRVADARPGERKTARWRLARYYLGHGFAAAARGVLQTMKDTDPNIASTAEWRAVHGAALLELNRPEEAAKALGTEELDSETEIWLWRALAAERAGRAEDALSHYTNGKRVLDGHSPAFQARMRLAAGRAALDHGSLDTAEREIAALKDMSLTKDRGAELDLLAGRLAEARGDVATARARLREASDARDRRVSAHARFALTELLLREGDIDRKEAVARLERLRFAWRGDEVEFNVLRKLGGLYVERGAYRKGLESYRQAASVFSDTPKAQEVTARMSQVFTDLFLADKADTLSPVAALALFYDFQELTPLGAKGDRMIRRLVDRLVAMDLLGRAADLLQHQVKNRLEGTGKAAVAAELAKIYLGDDKPKKALETMRATRNKSMPADVLRKRNLIEARALAELERYEEALVLLEDDRSRAAQLLRADIHWQNRDWPALARVSAEIMGGRHQSDEPLNERERAQLIRRALALSFMNRDTALATLRERYQPLIEDGAFEGIFNLVTDDEPLPEGELDRIAGRLAEAERYRSFLSAYRNEFALSDSPAPGPATAGGAS